MTLIDKTHDDDLIRRGDARKAMADYHWNRYASRVEGGTLSSPAVFTSHTWQDVQDAIAALPARGVGVKPLVWEGDSYCSEARSTVGWYIVQDEGEDGWDMWTPDQTEGDHPISTHSTLEAAKAAAQADYEARILAALSPAPVEAQALELCDLCGSDVTDMDGHLVHDEGCNGETPAPAATEKGGDAFDEADDPGHARPATSPGVTAGADAAQAREAALLEAWDVVWEAKTLLDAKNALHALIGDSKCQK